MGLGWALSHDYSEAVATNTLCSPDQKLNTIYSAMAQTLSLAPSLVLKKKVLNNLFGSFKETNIHEFVPPLSSWYLDVYQVPAHWDPFQQ